jgi:hypothetical protein
MDNPSTALCLLSPDLRVRGVCQAFRGTVFTKVQLYPANRFTGSQR